MLSLSSARDALNRCELALANRLLGTALTTGSARLWCVDGASGRVMVSDVLHGI